MVCLVTGTLLLIVLAILVVKLLVEVLVEIGTALNKIRKQFKKTMVEEKESA